VRRILTVAIVSTVALIGGTSWAGVHQVWDTAHRFKAETLVEIDPILQEIDGRFYKDLMIESLDAIPQDFRSDPKNASLNTSDLFDRFMIREGNALKINGILLVITQQPRHLQVFVGLDTRNHAFTLADRDELVALLTAAFRQGNFDAGLLDGVKFVRDRMAKNLAGPPAASAPATQPAANPATATQPATTLPATTSK